jgi:Flp pilus assembly protein TadD
MQSPSRRRHSDGIAPCSDTRSRRLLIVAWLVVANVFVFGQTIEFEFLNWDDRQYVVPYLEQFGGLSPESVRWAIGNQKNGWRTPISYLSLFLDAHVYGVSSAGLHLTNLLIHTASTLLLFFALRRMTRQTVIAGVAASLFAIHPLHVEPVAWVTGRWELLCGFFWVAGMWSYARYCALPSMSRYVVLVAAFCCALLSKPMALTFPFALLLLDYWPLQRLRIGSASATSMGYRSVGVGQAVIEKGPLFLIVLVSAIVFWNAKADFVESRGMLHFTLADKLLNAVHTYAIYTAQMVWPSKLSFFYLHPTMTGGFETWKIAAATMLLLTITGLVVRYCLSHPYLVVGWFWFLGVFVPAIGLFQVEHHARADRYTYIPLIGLILMVSWGVASVAAAHPVLVRVACGCFLTGLMVTAQIQTSHWRDSQSLFEHGVRVDDQNYKAFISLGTVLARNGNLADAEECYKRGVAICSNDYRAINNFGVLKYQRGDVTGARKLLERIVDVDEDLDGHYLLAICLADEGRTGEAVTWAEELLKRRPESPRSHAALAHVLAESGRLAAAESHYRQSLDIAPGRSDFAIELSTVLLRGSRETTAVDYLASYYAHFPNKADVANELCWILAAHDHAKVRDGERAVHIAERLCQATQHDNYLLLDTLSAAYAETNRFDDACRTAVAALELATQAGNEKSCSEIKERLDGYRAERPYRMVVVRSANRTP